MSNWITAAVCIIAFAIVGPFAAPTAFAKEIDLGKRSKDEVKDFCNEKGGDLLGVSESGAYGCELAGSNTLILCNKDDKCTGYVLSKKPSKGKKILDNFTSKAKPATKPSTSK